jgi:hypothetical protein
MTSVRPPCGSIHGISWVCVNEKIISSTSCSSPKVREIGVSFGFRGGDLVSYYWDSERFSRMPPFPVVM